MAFIYQLEKRKFEREWEQLRNEYEAAGMPQETIDQLYIFDWEWFCSRRSYENRNQALPAESVVSEDGEEQSSLVNKFKGFSVELDESLMGGRHGWMEQIENPQLVDKLRKLSEGDLELLTLVAIEGYSQSELERMGFEKQYKISRRMARITKFLENFK